MIRTTEELLSRLVMHGGGIVRSCDCSQMEIANAQARGDFYVDADGLGYVLRLKAWFDKKYAEEEALREIEKDCAHRGPLEAGDLSNRLCDIAFTAQRALRQGEEESADV